MSEEDKFPITKLSAGAEYMTAIFVARAKKGDKYVCWGCGFIADTPDDFVKHFQTHIDDFLRGKR